MPLLALLLPALAADPCQPLEDGSSTTFRILEVQAVPASTDEDAGDCGSAHTMATVAVVASGRLCPEHLTVALDRPADTAASLVGQEHDGFYSSGGQCWAELYLPQVHPDSPSITVLRDTDAGCAVERRWPAGSRVAQTLTTLPGACPAGALFSTTDAGLSLVLPDRTLPLSPAVAPPPPASSIPTLTDALREHSEADAAWRHSGRFAWLVDAQGSPQLPLMVAFSEGPHVHTWQLGEDGPLTLRWQNGWLLGCTEQAATLHSPEGELAWDDRSGVCPAFWPLP